MAKTTQKAQGSGSAPPSEDKGSNPTHDAFAVTHYRVKNDSGEFEVKERLVELGPCWPTQGGHMRLKMYTTPLEWLHPNNSERVIMIVERRGDNRGGR